MSFMISFPRKVTLQRSFYITGTHMYWEVRVKVEIEKLESK